ncbi:DUF2188 domain-containing protein [Melghirimyces algeriensis]|uniref:DUF2188 domain-containing protein n=1 Tax=Melghirimyces algeriensis TaxID=910412 RepID=A0A521C5A7_9BACL|nr:DUF2188 domain-containing protein [Melghirimyces algeriensis]SMO54697.1 hypothetical protein SAMN06264849_103142 [Melghirimyces algeriensis]
MSGKGKNQYVVRHEDKWAVRSENSERASKIFDTQKEAIEYGKERAKKEQAELRIQNRQGKFREANTYGPNDPYPPKG